MGVVEEDPYPKHRLWASSSSGSGAWPTTDPSAAKSSRFSVLKSSGPRVVCIVCNSYDHLVCLGRTLLQEVTTATSSPEAVVATTTAPPEAAAAATTDPLEAMTTGPELLPVLIWPRRPIMNHLCSLLTQ